MFLISQSCNSMNNYGPLTIDLETFIEDKDALIGICVIIDDKDTVAINGHTPFPMLSVYKFPIALALGEYYRHNNLSFDCPYEVLPSDILPDTYSPMRDHYGAQDTLYIPTVELLAYSLQQSDNNASDIILKQLRGVEYVNDYLERNGVSKIHVNSTEEEMYRNNYLCYENSATPIAMASLFNRFDNEFNDSVSIVIKRLIENCETGNDRLPAPLESTGAVIGHKTGTGFILPNGRLMALNDCGYVHLPNGHKYSIAVFIKDSGYDVTTTSTIIAGISDIVYNYLK